MSTDPTLSRAMTKKRIISFVSILIASSLALPGCTSDRAGFSSPREAAQSLVAALEPERDVEALERILGPDIEDLASSGDAVRDAELAREFLALYHDHHAFERGDSGAIFLVLGEDEWPFPIPMRERFGKWHFDTDAGREEIVNRRIGLNELDSIQTCLAIADAQIEYASLDVDGVGLREYAQKFRSEAGQRDGLYWPEDQGAGPSPMGSFAALAAEQGYEFQEDLDEDENVYRGYRFRILHAQGPSARGGAHEYIINGKMIGGFAVIAWPASYDASGIMTFIVSHHGLVYESDLGSDTEHLAQEITVFDPDASWKLVNDVPFVH